jgi:prepilin-type N-terminal cleavage/methylation domain-containing protein
MSQKNKHKKGFTLIELLLAITIFMMFIMVATDTFLEIIRAQKSANEVRQMYSEMRNFVDYVGNEMREGGIDYFCYDQGYLNELDFNQAALVRCEDSAALGINSNDNLRTISRDGLTSSIIKFDAEKEKVCVKRFRNSNDSWQVEGGYQNISSLGGQDDECGDYKEFGFANLKVKSLQFEIFPAADPKDPASYSNLATQIQPMVRMNVEVSSNLDTVKFDLDYQTLLTARN